MLNPGWYTEEDLQKAGAGSVGTNVRISKNNTLIGLDKMHFGSNIRIDDYCTIVTSKEPIYIANYVHIASHCHISGTYGVNMDDFTFIASGSRIYSGTDDYVGPNLINPTIPTEFLNIKSGKVAFKKYSGVGANCTVLSGVVLGEGSVMGAHSLTSKSLEPWKVYTGVPAKIVKDREKITDDKDFREWQANAHGVSA